MKKFVLFLFAISLVFALAQSRAEDVVVTRESILKYREKFLKRGARRKTREQQNCENGLMGMLIQFPVRFVATSMPNDAAAGSSAREILELLREVKDRGDDKDVLWIRKAGLAFFRNRMMELVNDENQFFTMPEVTNFSAILRMSLKGIFQKNPPGQNPIAEVTAFFKQDVEGFRALEKYSFLSAILTGVDMNDALAADPEFRQLINLWSEMHKIPVLKSDFDSVIQSKINQLPRQTG